MHANTRRLAREGGFTLIEVMIVVAIIGILAGVAVLSYRDYVIRAQVAEGLSLVGPAQRKSAVFFSENGRLPSSNASIALPPAASIAGHYVERVEVTGNGDIVVRYGYHASSAIAGAANQCRFSAVTAHATLIRWDVTCGFPDRYLPAANR
jgi:type IV pilus assembly protein PilA